MTESKNALVFRLDVGWDNDLLCQHGDETGVGQSFDNWDVKVGVDFFLDFVDVTDSQTVENVHQDNHQQVDEAHKDHVAKPVAEI